MTPVSSADLADRIALRELVDAYADCADRRDAAGQMSLFTDDCIFEVWMDARAAEPSYILTGRDALAPVFDALNTYEATTHFNGQCTLRLDGDRATGVAYCLAHHVTAHDDGKTLMIASIRYDDDMVRRGGGWLFSKRVLLVDWTDTRPLGSG